MQWAALDIADPESPVGARGVGEAPVGAGFGAIVNALSAALGDEIFHRAPVTPDKILMALEHGRPMHEALKANV
jgi:CO/xanthine dehydrogenase Mo-binding subunit